MDIDIRTISKSYFLNGKEIKVLENITYDIKSGEAIALMGPSGVGKSTMLHLVGTLDTPTKGFISYDGTSMTSVNDARIANFRNENIGFVFQFHHLLGEFSAQENVMLPLMMGRVKKSTAYNEAKKILSFVGLKERLAHKPGELSGGEQQRVALARALVTKPKILLADEPTGNLDDKTGQNIIDLLLEYNQKYNVTVILVTHNKAIGHAFKKRLLLKKDGLKEISS